VFCRKNKVNTFSIISFDALLDIDSHFEVTELGKY